jgi:hypothetical protein
MHAEGGGIELRELCDFLLALTDILLGKHRIKHDKEMLFIASKISFPGLPWPLRGYTFANIIFYSTSLFYDSSTCFPCYRQG